MFQYSDTNRPHLSICRDNPNPIGFTLRRNRIRPSIISVVVSPAHRHRVRHSSQHFNAQLDLLPTETTPDTIRCALRPTKMSAELHRSTVRRHVSYLPSQRPTTRIGLLNREIAPPRDRETLTPQHPAKTPPQPKGPASKPAHTLSTQTHPPQDIPQTDSPTPRPSSRKPRNRGSSSSV